MPDNKDSIYQYQPLWGKWYIELPLGKGSFGSVYKITREEMGSKYSSAVKVITVPSEEQYKEARASLGDDEDTLSGYFEDIVKNIVNEVNVLYALGGNPNIIGYHDHEVIKKQDTMGWDILIRMELVTSLPKYLESHRFSREQIVKLGMDICTALETCSKKGIIHRDIKDENVFISEDGVFKLGDFGIAKELSKSGRAASMRGTPLYMAPEVFRGEKYDAAVDIYSLGIVMYKLLNGGRMPFMPSYPQPIKFKDSEDALEKRISGTPLPPPLFSGAALGSVALQACAHDPKERYASATAMKQALVQALATMSEAERAELVTPERGKKADQTATAGQPVSAPTGAPMGRTVGFAEAAGVPSGAFAQTARPAGERTIGFAEAAAQQTYQGQNDERGYTQYQQPPYNPQYQQAKGAVGKKAEKKGWIAGVAVAAVLIAAVVILILSGVLQSFFYGSLNKENAERTVEASESAPNVSTDAGTVYNKATWTSDAGTVYNIVPKEDIVIGFNNGSTTVDFLRMVGDNLVEVCEREGVKIVVTESNFDVEQILPNVDNLIAQGANIIIDFNVNAEVGGNLVDYCGEKGIPVIGIDVVYPGPSGEVSWFFGANNAMAGTVAGEGLAEAVKERWGGEIEYLVLFHNNENGELVKLRMSEMQTGLINGGVDVSDDQVVWIEMGGGGSDTTVAANEKFTNWLAAHPDATKICIGTGNTETGQGVFSAAITANRWDDCLLATNNNGNQTLAAWETPEAAMWLGGVVYNPGQYGEYLVPLAIEIMAGENPDKVRTMDHSFLTIADIEAVKEEMGVS